MPSITPATALEVVTDAIAAAGLGTIAADLYMGIEVDGEVNVSLGATIPDAAIFVTEGDGLPHLTMGTIVALEVPTITALVRGEPGDYIGPRNKALAIRYNVGALKDFTSRGVKVLTAAPLGSILPLGVDAEGRHRFTAKFNVTTEPSYV